MMTHEDTPPALFGLVEPAPTAPAQIALHVSVESPRGRRDFWMSERGSLFFNRLDGSLCRASTQQAGRIMRGLDLARKSASFEVRGRTIPAADLDFARGLSAR